MKLVSRDQGSNGEFQAARPAPFCTLGLVLQVLWIGAVPAGLGCITVCIVEALNSGNFARNRAIFERRR